MNEKTNLEKLEKQLNIDYQRHISENNVNEKGVSQLSQLLHFIGAYLVPGYTINFAKKKILGRELESSERAPETFARNWELTKVALYPSVYIVAKLAPF